MTATRTHNRTESPTTVVLSSSDFKKLFAPSPDDKVSHYATYNRLQAKELLECLKEYRGNEESSPNNKESCSSKRAPRRSSPVPGLMSIFESPEDIKEEEVKVVDEAVESTDSVSTIASPVVSTDASTQTDASDDVSADIKWKPTLRPATFKQQVHRLVLFPKFMLLNCLWNVCEAVWIMIRDLWKFGGKPSKIFESNEPLALSSAPSFAGKKAPGYSCQVTFTKKFSDRTRFQTVFEQLCQDSGMSSPAEMGVVRWNDDIELLNEYSPDVMDVAGTHYVSNSKSYYAEGGRFKKWHVGIDMYESEGTTIMQAHLPGRAWDGTSCYNFVRELVHRYYSDDTEREASPVFKASDLIQLKDDVRAIFDNPLNVLRWAVTVPYNVYSNQSALCWQKASAAAGIDGYVEIPKELTHVNFNKQQSKQLSTELKKVGVAPTAALVFAGVHAYNLELGELPFSVVMQASLQTRAFEPTCEEHEKSFKQRRFVGDWLIGILHRVRTFGRMAGIDSYKVADAKKFYSDLITGLADTDASVRDGFYSRVLGKLKGGAAAFEKTPCFPGHSRLNDSLFFNNYGVRTVHPDSGCVGFNWSGAGKVGINCILVEGRLCCTVASTQLPLVTVEAIRDTFESIIVAMMNGEDGDEVVKRIAAERCS